jgi:hypothetical protein
MVGLSFRFIVMVIVCTVLGVVASSAVAETWSSDFSSKPSDISLYGKGKHSAPANYSANIENGKLELAEDGWAYRGNAVIDDFNHGKTVAGFTAEYDMQIGPGSSGGGSGGTALVFGDLPDGRFHFNDPDRLAINWAPHDGGSPTIGDERIGVFYDDQHLATVNVSGYQTASLEPVSIDVTAGGAITVSHDWGQSGSTTIFSNLQIPNWDPQPGWRFGFRGKSGLYNNEQYVDSVAITTNTVVPSPLAWTGALGLLAAMALIRTGRYRRRRT